MLHYIYCLLKKLIALWLFCVTLEQWKIFVQQIFCIVSRQYENLKFKIKCPVKKCSGRYFLGCVCVAVVAALCSEVTFFTNSGYHVTNTKRSHVFVSDQLHSGFMLILWFSYRQNFHCHTVSVINNNSNWLLYSAKFSHFLANQCATPVKSTLKQKRFESFLRVIEV